MEPNLPEHDHCRYCGNPVPFDMAYCCKECYYKDQERIRRSKRNDLIFAVLAVAGSAAILVLGYIF